MILQRDQTRSLLWGLLVLLEDLDVIDSYNQQGIPTLRNANFLDILYLEYHLYGRRMNERDKAGT